MYKFGATVSRLQEVTLMVTALALAGCWGDSSSSGSMSMTPLAQSGTSPSTGSRTGGTPNTGSTPQGTVTLTWIPPTENTNGTPLTDLAGYHIRYGTNPDALDQTILLPSTTMTAYEISGLASGTYYFAVSAYTSIGTESAESAVGYKTI